jgi:hypothetical protein
MRTAKKTSQGKANVKATAKAKKTSKAVAKAKPRSTAKAKATAQPKKRAVARRAKVAPKKAARPKAATSAKRKAASTTPRVQKLPPRRDGAGHLDPKYARDLRALSRENREEDDDRAFFTTPRSGDDLAEELGEQAVGTMTSGEDQSEHLIGEEVEEERGGPFVKTRGGEEFAGGTDRSNPRDATREPFPRT